MVKVTPEQARALAFFFSEVTDTPEVECGERYIRLAFHRLCGGEVELILFGDGTWQLTDDSEDGLAVCAVNAEGLVTIFVDEDGDYLYQW